MKIHALRLLPSQDLKTALKAFVAENHITAGAMITCVGSLNGAVLRMADENVINTFEGKFEIVSLVGTVSSNGCHLHISISDKDGNVFGGHVSCKGGLYSTHDSRNCYW